MIRLSQTAPWNSKLRNTYRTRYAQHAGRYFRIYAEYLNSGWYVEEIDTDGERIDLISVYERNLVAARTAIENHTATWTEHTMSRPGGEKRGNNTDRRNRKLKLLRVYGDGTTVCCVWCPAVLTYDTVEADRKIPGGSYRFDNVQPACRRCNLSRSNNVDWTPTNGSCFAPFRCWK
jgi:hypothetical protein